MTTLESRRAFLRQSAALGSLAAGYGLFGQRALAEERSANEKLNIGFVGTANQARFSIENLKNQNIVALCDVDDIFLGKAGSDFPEAKTYADFRQMLEQPDIDAVVVATADHTHAPATVMALRLGKHVYCEKPLTHSIAEARLVAQEAAKAKKATQMGTQIHASNNYRRVVEIIQSGAIGKVSEVHTWVGKGWNGGKSMAERPATTSTVHWDLWLGPAADRPFDAAYLPRTWRGWWDFGGGVTADMGCHHMDLPFWALGLRAPTSVAAEGPPIDADTCPLGIEARYEFPARGEQPPVKLILYSGERIPQTIRGYPTDVDGNLFVGDRGTMYAGYNNWKLLPAGDFAGYKPPEPTIGNSIGHHAEWVKACKDGSPTTCNFDYGGALTEAVLLANVSYRLGKPVAWDAANLRATGNPDAEKFIHKEYRQGWAI
jgi:predicted dehydrogenase